jgi:hypothetical protein
MPALAFEVFPGQAAEGLKRVLPQESQRDAKKAGSAGKEPSQRQVTSPFAFFSILAAFPLRGLCASA